MKLVIPGLSQQKFIRLTLGQGPLERAQVYEVRGITLARTLAGIPLGRLVVGRLVPGSDRKGRVGLPILEDLGVDARSSASSPAVHTE